jgi:hypothetical protein
MRKLTDHIVNGDSVNSQLDVFVLDEPGAGGAQHLYDIQHFSSYHSLGQLRFQNGPIKEHGVNGVTHEALLAILIDRLRGFQRGPFACDENAVALINLENALSMLQSRTKQRIIRNVEGTHQQ